MKIKKTTKKAPASKMMYGGDMMSKPKMQIGGQIQARTTSGSKKKPKK